MGNSLPEKTVIGSTECTFCGADVPIKVNGKGIVYYFCMSVIERDEKGKSKKQCRTGLKFNKDLSQQMINEFIEKEKEDVRTIENRQAEETRTEDREDTSGAEQQPEPARRSFGDAVGEFFS